MNVSPAGRNVARIEKPSITILSIKKRRQMDSSRWKWGLAVCVTFVAITASYFGARDVFLATSGAQAPTRPVLLLVGDSLTEAGADPDKAGWVTLLQNRYQRSADVLPRGLGGYNTKWFIEYALPAIDRELGSGRIAPALITLWIGANDAALLDGASTRQHVPLGTYSKNLASIIRVFRTSAPDAQILLITPPHVDEAARLMRSKTGRLDRSNAVTGEYARACVGTARELDIPVLDLHSFFNTLPPRERASCLEDGLHFTARGNRLVEQQIRAKIAASFPELAARLKVWQLPNWSKLT